MKQAYAIGDFLEDNAVLELSGTSIYDEETYILMEHDEVYRMIENMWSERCIVINNKNVPKYDPDRATYLMNVFSQMYSDWKTRRGTALASLCNAMLMQYNPIENYDSTETKTGTETNVNTPTNRKETETQTPTQWKTTETQTPTQWKETETKTPTQWKETETQTPTNWINEVKDGADNTQKPAEATTNKVVPFNGSTAEASSITETELNKKSTSEQKGTFQTEKSFTGTYQTETSHTGTYQTETAQSGTFTTEKALSGTVQDQMTYNTEFKRHGNIGVVSAMDLLLKEVQVRMLDYIKDALQEFIDEYTIYV